MRPWLTHQEQSSCKHRGKWSLVRVLFSLSMRQAAREETWHYPSDLSISSQESSVADSRIALCSIRWPSQPGPGKSCLCHVCEESHSAASGFTIRLRSMGLPLRTRTISYQVPKWAGLLSDLAWRSIARGMGRHDYSWILWQIVLVAGPRPNGTVTKYPRGWDYLWICSQDHCWWVCYLGVGLPSQNDLPQSQSWGLPGFYNLLSGSQKCHKGTFIHGWLPNYCCWGAIQVGALLSHHLANITPTNSKTLFFFFCEFG